MEYCSTGWCSAADAHLRQLDRIVSGASFLTGFVLGCDLAHRRSVAVLCMLYKIRCNDDVPSLRCSSCAVCAGEINTRAHRFTYAPPRCRKSQCRRTFILWSVSLWNDLIDPVFDGVGLAGFKSRADVFLFA